MQYIQAPETYCPMSIFVLRREIIFYNLSKILPAERVRVSIVPTSEV